MSVLDEQMRKVSAKEAGQVICEALKIPTENVRSIEMSIVAGQPPTITVSWVINKKRLEGIESIIKQYGFVEVVPGEENEDE